LPNVAGTHYGGARGWRAGAGRERDRGARREQTRPSHLHDRRNIEQMIDVSMGSENHLRTRNKLCTAFDLSDVRPDLGGDGKLEKGDAREIRIDQQDMPADSKAITVRPEISDAESAGRRCR
jgi:hypothetical protein